MYPPPMLLLSLLLLVVSSDGGAGSVSACEPVLLVLSLSPGRAAAAADELSFSLDMAVGYCEVRDCFDGEVQGCALTPFDSR
jgi:hypothetical protein